VLPLILESLLDARKRVKSALSTTPVAHHYLRMILSAREKALKIAANAAYGFTGSNASRLAMVELAESTITYGAELLLQNAVWVQQQYKHAKIIYGDTDSVRPSRCVRVSVCLSGTRRLTGSRVPFLFVRPLSPLLCVCA
jgi:DNA polymerase elongation subunit (family B)